ncbi:MAG: hypothetical protein PQJ61_15840 [Spirochaetales bacterium]|uniref:Uncharacterized protein n=1 Tax=Candidatus Thalassospirochaeta sargassi TaxID=3119039 RepID=A0AAJ1IHE9_9SPIO|nr:hypothetical protein [Spirochaetales bacterium]
MGLSRIITGQGFITFLLYVRAFGQVPLSEAFAFNSLNYILVFLADMFIPGDKPNMYRGIGRILITCGFLFPLRLQHLMHRLTYAQLKSFSAEPV